MEVFATKHWCFIDLSHMEMNALVQTPWSLIFFGTVTTMGSFWIPMMKTSDTTIEEANTIPLMVTLQ